MFYGTTLCFLDLCMTERKLFSVSRQPRNPRSRLLFMLLTFSMLWPSQISTNHQWATSSSLSPGRNPFSFTILSHTASFPFMASCSENGSPLYSGCTLYSWASNCHSRFHLNTSPLLLLKASFFTLGSATDAAQISCSATRSASDASCMKSQHIFLPGKIKGFFSYWQMAAYTANVLTMFIRLPSAKPKIAVGRWMEYVSCCCCFTVSNVMSSRVW